ncbi:MAG: TonB family protein [Methylobacterium mesophilicum]|nr:TonB family protein [Methylobacterium mesophilicum]
MKAGLSTSVIFHAAVLGVGLISLGAPKPLDAGATESLPVSVISSEELAQMVQGDKTAALSEKPAPKPTTKPDVKPDAQNIGDNDNDLSTPPTPEPSPREVKQAAAQPESEPTPEPTPVPTPEPAPKVEPAPKPEPTPATETKVEPTPKQDVKPEPTPEQKTAEATPDALKLPDNAPSPAVKPKPTPPAEAQTAKAPDKKEAEKPAEKKTAQKTESKDKSLEDEVAMLLNKQKASGGGAKRSTEQASLGGKKTTGAKLSQGEMDALRSQLSGCWSIPAGAEGVEGLRVSVSFSLDASGKLDGRPQVTTSSGDATFDQSAVRAVQKCDNAGFTLPMDKADTWSQVVVNFDPSEMF